jgi:hypothetical protein
MFQRGKYQTIAGKEVQVVQKIKARYISAATFVAELATAVSTEPRNLGLELMTGLLPFRGLQEKRRGGR